MVTNLSCLIESCKNKQIDYTIIDPALVRVNINNKFYYFFLCNTPLNSQDVVKITKDKAYTYLILREIVRQPKTIIYFNPDVKAIYKKYVKITSDELNLMISQWPKKSFVVKMNQGKRKKNVFFCYDIDMVFNALRKIFNQNSKDYDYIALIQEWIDIANEYRLIYLNHKLIFAYEKKVFRLVDDMKLIQLFDDFIQPIFQYLDIKYCGIDLIVDKNNSLYLLEINSAPGFNVLVKTDKNNRKLIVDLYSKILDYINN